MSKQLVICFSLSTSIVLLGLCAETIGANSSSSLKTLAKVRRNLNSLLEASKRVGVTREFERGFKLFSHEPKHHKKTLDLWDAIAERLAYHSKRLSDKEWSCSSRKDFNKMFNTYFYEPCLHLKDIDSEINDQYKAEVTTERYNSIVSMCSDLLKPRRRPVIYRRFKKELEVHNSRDCYE